MISLLPGAKITRDPFCWKQSGTPFTWERRQPTEAGMALSTSRAGIGRIEASVLTHHRHAVALDLTAVLIVQ